MRNLIASPTFHSRTIFEENLIAIEMNKTELIFIKPLYVDMAMLDLSKIVMYQFLYEYLISNLPQGSDIKVFYMDTDSFIMDITGCVVYELMKRDCHEKFDTADYHPDNMYGIPQVNSKVLGMMKDEAKGVIIPNYADLRSKMFCFNRVGRKCTKKATEVKLTSSKRLRTKIILLVYKNAKKQLSVNR